MSTKILVIGYGNPGRLDDGLGPALADRLAGNRPDGVDVDANYQLNVEDAADVANHDVVVFADAAVSGPEPFSFRILRPAVDLSFTTHSVEPEVVLGLAHRMFGARTAGYVLGIRGYEFNAFGERLSDKARHNLGEAEDFLLRVIGEDSFEDHASGERDGVAVRLRKNDWN